MRRQSFSDNYPETARKTYPPSVSHIPASKQAGNLRLSFLIPHKRLLFGHELSEADTDIKYRLDVIGNLRYVDLEINKCKENIATLEKNSNMIMKHTLF